MRLEIIGTGLGRTGTMSLKLALEKLLKGPCMHMEDFVDQPERLRYLTVGRLRRGRPDWERFLAGYKAAVDYPVCLHYAQLFRQYPQLKAIHTLRDPESWYESVTATTWRYMPKGPLQALRATRKIMRSPKHRRRLPAYIYTDLTIWRKFFGNQFGNKQKAIEIYRRHEADVRATIPAGQLLLYNISDGWEPLCEFLGVPVPEAPFPQANSRKEFIDRHERFLAARTI